MKAIPDTLLQLAEWVHNGRCTVQDLEFYEEFNQEYRPSSWTGNPDTDLSFGTFAQDGAGGQYALWFDAPGGGLPPVVKLGDDGDLVPLAGDALEFAWLIACGVEPIGVGEDGAFAMPPVPCEPMQDWVRGQDPERDFDAPAEVIARAAREYPTFVEVVRGQVRT